MDRGDLSDAEWAIVGPLLPSERGRPRRSIADFVPAVKEVDDIEPQVQRSGIGQIEGVGGASADLDIGRYGVAKTADLLRLALKAGLS